MILTEEQRGTVAFDLERARDAVKMYNSRNPNVNTAVWAHNCAEHLPGAIDLIERQTAEIERLRAYNEWLKADREFGVEERIQELEDALVDERAKYNVAGHGECSYRTPIRNDPLLWKCDKGIVCDWNCCPIKDEKLVEALQELQAEGTIGPGTVAPPCWKITEERVEAIQDTINRYDVYDRCLVTHDRKMHVLKVLRAMIEEAK